MDLAQAEAVAACIDAATLRAGKQAQRQLQGAFGLQIEHLMERLTGMIAHVEASLDFPEEDIPELYFEHLKERMQAEVIQPVKKLLNSAKLGERLFDGAVVAIVGAPNVGKSSLLNALAGYDRASSVMRQGRHVMCLKWILQCMAFLFVLPTQQA
jgi:tRNA modification GTPase